MTPPLLALLRYEASRIALFSRWRLICGNNNLVHFLDHLNVIQANNVLVSHLLCLPAGLYSLASLLIILPLCQLLEGSPYWSASSNHSYQSRKSAVDDC